MPTEDEVRVIYRILGTDEGKRLINELNASIRETPPAAGDAAKQAVSLEAGIGGLAGTIGLINPRFASLLTLMESAKFVSGGVTAGLANIRVAFSSLLGLLANPIFLGAAAVITAIWYAQKQAADETARLEEKTRQLNEALKDQQKIRDEAQGKRRETAEQVIPQIEESLIRAGLKATSAGDVGLEAARATRRSGIPVEETLQVAREFVEVFRELPTADQIAQIAGARRLEPDLAGRDVAEVLQTIPALTSLAEANRQRSESIGAQVAIRDAQQFVEGIIATTNIGVQIKSLEDELVRNREAIKNLEESAATGFQRGFFEELLTTISFPTNITDPKTGQPAGVFDLGTEDLADKAFKAVQDSQKITTDRLEAIRNRDQDIITTLGNIREFIERLLTSSEGGISPSTVQNFYGTVNISGKDTTNPGGRSIAPRGF